MIEVSADELKQAVEHLHACRATFRDVEPVIEKFQGQTVWEGIVHTFDIEGNADANACFAWSSPIEGSERRKFYGVLQVAPIATAADAVRVSIVADYKK